MRNGVLIAGGVCLLVGLGVLWFVTNYERVPYKERVPPSAATRLRQFLAAERFAERMGMAASEIRSLPELAALRPDGVLLLPARRQALDAGRLKEIAAWVERGGHLVVEAEALGVPDPLLELLDVERSTAVPVGKPLAVEIEGRKLLVSLSGRMVLKAPRGARLALHAGPAESAQLVSFARGKGAVTAATSLHFARNGQIGAHDHAALLWELLALTDADALQVYHRPERLSLVGFLKERAPQALGAVLALLALWLWRIAPRFGPVAPDAPLARRRLLDHLRASGRYYWANGLRGELVIAARDAALRRLTRAQPDFANASPAERAARLAALAGISQAEAASFLAASGRLHSTDFVKLTHHAQRTHAALEKGKK